MGSRTANPMVEAGKAAARATKAGLVAEKACAKAVRVGGCHLVRAYATAAADASAAYAAAACAAYAALAQADN